MVYHNEDGSITSNAAPRTMIGENAIIAAKDAEIARLTSERDAYARHLNDERGNYAEQIGRAEKAEAALSESQAREAALHHAITEASDPDFIWGAMDNVNDMDVGLEEFAKAASRAIRAAVPTPADAQAALDARINAAKEEGRVMGLRAAAEIAQSLHDRAATKGQVLNRNTVGKAILAKIKEAE